MQNQIKYGILRRAEASERDKAQKLAYATGRGHLPSHAGKKMHSIFELPCAVYKKVRRKRQARSCFAHCMMNHFTADQFQQLHKHDHPEQTQELLEHRPQEEAFIAAADTFGQLCDSTRLKILWLLAHSEECVSNIALLVDMSAPAVSHHLRSLRQSGLIVNRREGKEIYYRLADTPKAELLHKMIDAMFDITHDGKA